MDSNCGLSKILIYKRQMEGFVICCCQILQYNSMYINGGRSRKAGFN